MPDDPQGLKSGRDQSERANSEHDYAVGGEHQAADSSEPSLAAIAIGGCCPRCGSRTLFDGLANFAPKCRVCGLEFAKFNVGDGPAAFLTLIIGAVVVALAMWLELAVRPPLWVHALIWLPFTGLAVVLGLRAGKAIMLALEYRHDAHEAGSVTPGDKDVGLGEDKPDDER